jgi:hypothetical protein
MYRIVINGITFTGRYSEVKALRDQADRYGIFHGGIWYNN